MVGEKIPEIQLNLVFNQSTERMLYSTCASKCPTEET